MSKVENLILSDWLGREYMFEVYPKRTEFNSVPGVYLFTRRSANQHGAFHEILYIGKTKSFKNRLNYNHEKWIPANRMGFTHICVPQLYEDKLRTSVKKSLIWEHYPHLNKKAG